MEERGDVLTHTPSLPLLLLSLLSPLRPPPPPPPLRFRCRRSPRRSSRPLAATTACMPQAAALTAHCIALATRATAVQVHVRGSVVYVAGHCPSGAEDAFHKKDMPQDKVVPRP